ncbi:MAG: amidophosphoribosyltransferase [Lachnospirales bacterium]
MAWDDELYEECGVFGVFHHAQAAMHTYFALHALQHRGQEGAGIAASDGVKLYCHKGRGLAAEVFHGQELDRLPGENSIGHVRYSTAGGDVPENVQPLMARSQIGSIAAAHNGQIVNANILRQSLEEQGSIFFSSSDSEIILHLIQRGKGCMMDKIAAACRQMEGAFAFLILTEHSLYAVRDRHGLRPLSMAAFDSGYCVSSETCAIEAIQAQWQRDILPGEIVKFSEQGVESCFYTAERTHHLCAMEYIYFARPDSTLDGLNVHTVRRRSGVLMAQKDMAAKLKADIVVGVPDSSLSAAAGYAEAACLPNEMGLIKNRYVGRTFIEPTQEQRDLAVRMKLSANRDVVRGKRIVLIDDSVVRGTTSQRIIRLLKEAGAREVHLRIASPPLRWPCFYGIDIATRKELISAHMDPDVLARQIGADSLRFLEVADMEQIYGKDRCCYACFDGNYLTSLYDHEEEVRTM